MSRETVVRFFSSPRRFAVEFVNAIEQVWKKSWFGYLLIAGGLFVLLWFYRHLPPAGYAATTLAVVAGAMALRAEMGGREKWLWFGLLFAFLGVEIRAINNDRHDQNQQFHTIASGLETSISQGTSAITQSQQQFQSTMNKMKGILTKEDNTLTQTMGGAGYPFFLPTFPIKKDPVFPVKVFYRSPKKLPLVDVNVDVMLRPSKNESWNNFIITSPVVTDENAAMGIFHPKHFNLGTVLPGASAETPIELPAGKHYSLTITTRRAAFYELINLDKDDNEPGGWKVSWCLYRLADNKLLDGKCE